MIRIKNIKGCPMKQPLRTLALFLILFPTCFVLCQNIALPEEEILGQDVRIKKTEMFFLTPPATVLKFPKVPILRFEKPKPEVEITVTKPEADKRRNYLRLSGGSYNSAGLCIFFLCKQADYSCSVSAENDYAGGYRKHSREISQKVKLNLRSETFPAKEFSIEVFHNNMQLPGPVFSPFLSKRECSNVKIHYSFEEKDSPFSFNVGDKYYYNKNYESNYFTFCLDFRKNNWRWRNRLLRNDFTSVGARNSLSTGMLFSKDDISVGGDIRIIEGTGGRFLPYASVPVGKWFTLKVDSNYAITDFWDEFQTEYYKELKKESLKPVENYGIHLICRVEKEDSLFSFEVSGMWWKHFYTWEDTDLNFLWEPKLEENLWAYDISLNLEKSIFDSSRLFLRYKKKFFSRNVEYVPADCGQAGLLFQKKAVEAKLWVSYVGDRTFSSGALNGYFTLNSHLSYRIRDNVQLGISVLNISGKSYEMVPGYPGEKRKFLSYVKLDF